MIARCWIAFVLLAAGVSTASAEEFPTHFSLTSYFDTQSVNDHEVCCCCNDDCCGAGIGCDEAGGNSASCESTSRVDWFLPRSNLPLPLMKEMVESRGVTFPLPLGASVIWTELNRPLIVTDLRAGLGDNPPESLERFDVGQAAFRASATITRLDLWVLPFLNIYGLAGRTTSVGRIPATVEDFPSPGSPSRDLTFDVRMTGPTYGLGATVAAGTKDFFFTLDINKTKTKFAQLESEINALVVTPRVGIVIDRPIIKGAFHVGAMWQDTAQTVEVILPAPDLGQDIHLEIDQVEPKAWNFLVGGLWAIDERVHILVEGGMGGRSYVLSGVTVRF